MRILLFRAKRMDTGDWIYGHYMEFGAAAKRVYCIAPDYASSMCVVDVCKKTVGQFTGLIDRNGNKIFEGDILQGKGKHIFYVEYSSKIASFVTRAMDGGLATPCMNYGTMLSHEVIGNIHDPEQYHETGT